MERKAPPVVWIGQCQSVTRTTLSDKAAPQTPLRTRRQASRGKAAPHSPRAIASRQARHWWCPTSCCIRLDQSSASPSFVLLLPTHRPRSYPGSMSSPGARRRRWLGGGMTAVALVAAVAGLVGGLWPSSPSSRASSSNSPPQDSAQVPPVVQITSTMAQDAPGTLWEGN